MSKTLKRILAMALVICALLSYTVPAANAAANDITTLSFDLTDYYTYSTIPTENDGNDLGVLHYLITGYTSITDNETVMKSMIDRYVDREQNWTYEAASAGLCGSETANEHLTGNGTRMINMYKDSNNKRHYGIRTTMAGTESAWLAFRFRSPGAGEYTLDFQFYCGNTGAPTLAFYILDPSEIYTTEAAQGSASNDHDTILARQECIQTAMDPNNRIGKVDENAVDIKTLTTAYVGEYTFEADKEYILVAETYEKAAVPGHWAYLQNFIFSIGGTVEKTELKGEPEVGSILVEKNLVPASDGGYMAAVTEVNGHDYYFRPLEGGKMAIFDLDKHIAGEESLVATVSTGLYYPTHATAANGKVIVGGDGKKLFIFDTKTMTGRTTPDFRAFEGLADEGHNQGSHYGSDGYLYFGTLYGGHLVQYDIATKTYLDLGDVVTASVQAMAGITANPGEEIGAVRATYYHNGYLYAKIDSDNYTIIVKQDVANKQTVAAINVTDQLHGSGVPHGITVLGDKYLIAGGSGGSGMVLIDLATFKLVNYNDVVSKGLFASKTAAAEAWTNGMSGHASEEIDGKQYFTLNNTSSLYYYEVESGRMVSTGKTYKPLRTGQKTTVTLEDENGDGEPDTYLVSFASTGLRLYNIDTNNRKDINDLKIDMEATGGSSLNIGDSYNDVLYIGAWNNWNCVAYDTVAEEIKSRYETGGQTDSQVSYVDDDGTFHLVSGNYSACVVYEIDPDNKTTWDKDGNSNIKMALISNMKGYEQKRIHTVTGGDGYVFAGTIPTSYVTGGGVGVYNRETGTEDFIRFKETSVNGEKVVPNEELWDLAVQCIEYYDGRLFGTTTRSGGTASTPVDGTSARIFVMDYENMTIEATLDLREHLLLPGKDANGDNILQKEEMDPIRYIGGIQVDDQGRFWGLCSDVLFCFTYDKATMSFDVKEILNLNHSEYVTSAGAAWKSHKVVFDPANYQLFVSFYKNGLRQVVLGADNWNAAVADIDVTGITHTQILTSGPATFALGANNNLYYVSGTDLYMKPVNVADNDAAWTNAQNVDNMLEALGDITADKADDVAAVKAAYNALSLREKALVQETRYLKEVEAQVLELQIEEAIANVTAGSQEELGELIVQYNALEADQQRYVQNITALEEAYNTSIDLVDEAAEVQAQINTLPDVATLADEETVIAVRAAYEALDEAQKKLVNTDKLVAAEAQIILLKEADTVQEQINALPDTVTLSDEAAVTAARQAYDELSAESQAKVDTTKLVAAEAQIADLKVAQPIQALIDALPETVTLDDEAAVVAARDAYNSTTTAVRKLITTTRLAAAEAQLKALKNAVATEYVYDFKLFQNANYMTWLKDTMVGKGVAETATIGAHTLYRCTVDSLKYDSPVNWFKTAYSDVTNWAPEGVDGGNTTYLKNYNITTETGMYLLFEHPNEANTKKDFGALRIEVPASGNYQLDLSLFEGPLTKSYLNTGDVLNVYLIPVDENYTPTNYATSNNKDTIATYLTDDTYLAGSLTYQSQENATDTSVYTIGGKHQLDAGEYIMVIQESATNTCRHVYLDSLTLKKVVATVGDQEFGSLDDAFAYQIENGADSVKLYSDLEVADLVLEPGAVLDLNGKILTADSVLSYESSEIVDNSEKDTGVLVISNAEGNMLSSNNAQLPVYDATAGGYRFFEVTVSSVAITGKNSANPKYWFQVSCVNFDEIHKLIDAGSELNITVKMSWNGGEADAVAGADFLKQWADAFANNENIYITVSAVNTEGLESFSLIPAVSANGVTVKGGEM